MANGPNGWYWSDVRTASSVSSLQSRESKFGEERYFNIAKRLYKDLDEHLSTSDFLAGKNYSIADIATFPWIARHNWHDIGLKSLKFK